MASQLSRSAWFAAGMGSLITILGCEQKSNSPVPEKKPETPAKSNIDAIKEATSSPARPAARPSAGATQGDGALPPGHPPIGAGQPSPAPVKQPNLPAGHPAVDPSATPANPSTSTGGIAPPPLPAAGDPRWDVPKDFVETPPANAMRRAQYKLPRVEGDAEDGEIIVNYFGPGQGGNVMANLERWRGQFSNADGTPLAADAGKTDTFDAGKLKVTVLDVSGRMSGGMTPGAPATSPKDNYRMLAAMVETSKGPWFFKCTGPQKTIEKHAEAIRTMLKSVRE